LLLFTAYFDQNIGTFWLYYYKESTVKDIMVNTQTLAAATQILDQSAVNQGNPLQQSHTRILSPYKTYS